MGLTHGMQRAVVSFKLLFVLVLLCPCRCTADNNINNTNTTSTEYWEHWGNTQTGTRFSPLTDINKGNVRQLKKTWQYDYGLAGWEGDDGLSHNHQTTPLVIDAGLGDGTVVMVFCAPWNKLFAIDPTSGEHLWDNDNGNEDRRRSATCRGLATWLDKSKRDGELCRRRVVQSTRAGKLHAVDAATGRECNEFGIEGFVNITTYPSPMCNLTGLPDDPEAPPPYNGTSRPAQQLCVDFKNPPAVVNDVLVMGSAISDYLIYDTPKGQVVGFNASDGAELWRWYVIPPNKTYDPLAYATWENGTEGVGSANVWAPISGDDDLGLAFVATSSPSGEFYGGHRLGDNLYSGCVIALNVSNGEKVWHYQITRHDIWNYDLPAQPSVTTITVNGAKRRVVIQHTKQSYVFVLDARTGEPVFPVRNMSVPPSDVPGERTATHQPVPDYGDLANLTPVSLNINEELWGETPEEKRFCRKQFFETWGIAPGWHSIYDPPLHTRAKLEVPGKTGGGLWGGMSLYPDREIAVTALNHYPNIYQVIPRNEPRPSWCSYKPSIGFHYKECILQGLFDSRGRQDGAPCYRPQWARLVALNMTSGKLIWSRAFGYQNNTRDPQHGTTYTAGGMIVTASGLIIAGATEDKHLRVYDLETGEELWMSETLPVMPSAVPITYRINGTQYIVINVGGYGWQPHPDRKDHIFAYTIEETITTISTTTTSTTPVVTSVTTEVAVTLRTLLAPLIATSVIAGVFLIVTLILAGAIVYVVKQKNIRFDRMGRVTKE